MPPAQRSILSFFQSSSSSSSSAPPTSNANSFRPLASAPPPPPPPPPLSKFVPPPSANGAALRSPPPGTTLRTGGSPDPKLELPAVTADEFAQILQKAGAQLSGDELVFPSLSTSENVVLAVPRPSHIPDLVSVNAILLSVRYPDAFYRPLADRTRVASLFNRVLLDGDKVVGGLVCRLEPWPWTAETDTDKGNNGNSNGNCNGTPSLVLYVQALALLSPYRSRGLAAAALDSLAATAAALSSSLSLPPVRAVYAHVWTESDDALHWYESRGFARYGGAPIENYYFALRPGTAWVMRKDLPLAESAGPPMVTVTTSTSTTTTTTRPAPPTPSLSFQNVRPNMEWNDLPADMVSTTSASASVSASAASSRNASRLNLADSDSTAPPLPPLSSNGPPAAQAGSRGTSGARKKRDRAYPAAMFGQ